MPSAVLDPCSSAPCFVTGDTEPGRGWFLSSRLQNKKSRSKAQGRSKNLALPAPWSDMGSGRGTAKALMGTAWSLGSSDCPGVSSAPRAGFPWLHQLNPPSAMPTHTAGKVIQQGSSSRLLEKHFGSEPHPAPPEHPKLPPAPLLPCRRTGGHPGRLRSFALFVRPQTPQAGIQR